MPVVAVVLGIVPEVVVLVVMVGVAVVIGDERYEQLGGGEVDVAFAVVVIVGLVVAAVLVDAELVEAVLAEPQVEL